MKFKQAKRISDWQIASEILLASIRHLDSVSKSLWTESEVSIAGLKNSYQLEELHFIFEERFPIGVVFLQRLDPIFWPEETKGDSLFFHKLAIDPRYSNLGKGSSTM